MSHATAVKFGHPGTLIAEYEHWMVLLRPKQVTLGSLVVVAKSEALRFASLPEPAFTELATVCKALETGLARALQFDKINYLMLMMTDPHVHFHVLPRFASPRRLGDESFADHAWPTAPDVSECLPLSQSQLDDLQRLLKSHWP